MEIVGTVVLFLLVLGALVLVHEWGHFFAAKKFGIKVHEFGVGFPPRIFGKVWRGTLYTVNWLPLGGFVRIKGIAGEELEEGSSTDDPDSFSQKPFWQRFIVLFAGIGMNLVLAFVVFSITFMVGARQDVSGVPTTEIPQEDRALTVIEVLPESPADRAGIQPGDTIIAIGDEQLHETEQLRQLTSQLRDESSTLTYVRGDETVTVDIAAEEIASELGEGTFIGVGILSTETATVQHGFFQSMQSGAMATVSVTMNIVLVLYDMLSSALTGQSGATDGLAGPVGIAVTTTEAAQEGIGRLLQLVGILSVNLALFNLLPIPALDGGRIAFTIAEAIARRPLNPKIESAIHQVGFLLLLLLVLIVTVRDIAQYI